MPIFINVLGCMFLIKKKQFCFGLHRSPEAKKRKLPVDNVTNGPSAKKAKASAESSSSEESSSEEDEAPAKPAKAAPAGNVKKVSNCILIHLMYETQRLIIQQSDSWCLCFIRQGGTTCKSSCQSCIQQQ